MSMSRLIESNVQLQAQASTIAPRLRRAERREQLLGAAAEAFVRGGFDGTSMDDVARSAGVTRLIVYRIFDTKEALYLAVLESVIHDLADVFGDVERAASRDPAPIGAVLLGIARRHPDGFRLLWRHASHEPTFSTPAGQFRAAVHDYARQLLAEAISDPTMRGWAAESVAAHLFEGICLWLDHGDAGRDDEFVRMLTTGVRAMIIQWGNV